MMKRLTLLWLLGFSTLIQVGCQAPPPPITLTIDGHQIVAEVASSPAARATGLMHRDRLGESNGMLFVFPQAGQHCMWMKDTMIPLSVAFLDANGWIVNTADMQPGSLTQHCATGLARFALEMDVGWFARHGGRVGTKVSGLETLSMTN